MSRGGVARRCVLLLLAAMTPAPVLGQTPLARPGAVAFATDGATPVLDVPFVPQSPALCGGAAVAMVLRYFGERGVYAEDFASLVVASGAGIKTDDLAAAVRQRGWHAVPFAGDADLVQRHLEQGRPIIALIEDRPGRYHYVVVVAWHAGTVVLHDPARGPAREVGENRFTQAWQTTGRWAMLVLPAGAAAAPASARVVSAVTAPDTGVTARAGAEPATPDACSASLDAAVLAARGGELEVAERNLVAAGERCADRAAVTVELAALRFQQRRYREAADLASSVLTDRPDRTDAWDLLASSHYLLADGDGALRAWNRIGRPRNDLTRIDGLRATPFQVVNRAVGIGAGELVSSESLGRARRRVGALPTVLRTRVDYRPVRGGDVEVQASVMERPVLPLSVGDLLVHGMRALADSRLRVDVANALRVGEAWLVDWVWQRARRAVELGLAAADAFRAGGLWQLHAADRTFTYRLAALAVDSSGTAPVQRETHAAATMSVSDWVSGALHWQVTGSLEGWSGRGAFAGVLAQVQLRSWHDRVALRVRRGGWWSIGGSDAFHTLNLQAEVRSATVPAPSEWSARGGLAVASDNAPRTRWTGAGNHFGTDALLRAHELIDGDGITKGAFFGPRLVHAGVELRRWLRPLGPVQLGGAAFVDAATVRPLAGYVAARTAFDVGAGVRLRFAGRAGAIRADAALGVTDGAAALSLGWVPGWPAW